MGNALGVLVTPHHTINELLWRMDLICSYVIRKHQPNGRLAFALTVITPECQNCQKSRHQKVLGG
jgi:hypothetical protein